MSAHSHEVKMIRSIVKRARDIAIRVCGYEFDDEWVNGASVAVAVANINYRLDLKEMVDGNESDIVHDVFGILRHLDMKTGVLEDCFVPRYAIQ